MPRFRRRRMLKLSGATALAAGGGLAGILASRRAPAYAQGTALHWLKFVDFVPVSDQLLKGRLRDECQKALGISLTIETINGDGVQARITSAIQSKTGPDIMMAVSNWAQLYAETLVDVSDIAEEVGRAHGGYYDTAHAVANNGKKWIAMPFTILGVLFVNRTTWFAEEGITPDKLPKTWEDYRAVGKKLKAKGRPLGQTLAHAFGDGPAFWYPYLWSWGGKEVEADGKTVVLNSKATIESGQIRNRLLEGRVRRRRHVMGRCRQQPRLSRQYDQFDQQRCLDLPAGQGQAGHLHDRDRQAA